MLLSSSLLADFRRFLSKNKFQHIYVGYSGGIDSTVLLHILANSELLPKLTALHINHNIDKKYSNIWQQHCAQFCQNLKIGYVSHNVSIDNNSCSLEEAARDARYSIFAQYMQDAENLLCTAHHLDDQAETILLKLMRASSVRGLAGIPKLRNFANGKLYRPLLSYSKDELQQYINDFNLSYIQDNSNKSLNYDRNYIRHKIIPLLKKRWPQYLTITQQTSSILRESANLNEEITELDYKNCMTKDKFCLNLLKLKALSVVRQNNLLLFWLRTINAQQLKLFSYKQLHELKQQIFTAKQDAQIDIRYSNYHLKRYNNCLYAVSKEKLIDCKDISYNYQLGDEINIQHLNICIKSSINNNFLKQNNILCWYKILIPEQATLTIHFRRGGEVIILPNHNHTTKLKKFLQSSKLAPWERNNLPLLSINGKINCIFGLCAAEQHKNAQSRFWYFYIFSRNLC